MKRLAFVVVALFTVSTYAADDWHGGIGLTNEAGQHRVTLDSAKRWTCSLSGLVASLTQCQALAAGRTYFITDIVVGTTTATAGDYSIQSGTGANCVTGTAAVWPAAATTARFKAPIAANPSTVVSLSQPLAVTAGHAICVIGTAVNTINIQLSGFYTP